MALDFTKPEDWIVIVGGHRQLRAPPGGLVIGPEQREAIAKARAMVIASRSQSSSDFTKPENWIKSHKLVRLSDEQLSGLTPKELAAREQARLQLDGPPVAPSFGQEEIEGLLGISELVGQDPLLQKAERIANQAEEELAAELRRGRLFDLTRKYGQEMVFRRTLDGALVRGSIALFQKQPPGLYYPVIGKREQPADPMLSRPEKVPEAVARTQAIASGRQKTLTALEMDRLNQVAAARLRRRLRLGLSEEEMTKAQQKGSVESDEDLFDQFKRENAAAILRARDEERILDERRDVSVRSRIEAGDPIAEALKEEGLLASTYPSYMTIGERRLAQTMVREGLEKSLEIEDLALGVSDKDRLERINVAATAAREQGKARAKEFITGIIATRGPFTEVEKVFQAASNTVDGMQIKFPGGGTLGLGKASTLSESGEPLPREGPPIVLFRAREILDPVKRDELGAKSEKVYLEKVEGDFPSRKRVLRFRMAGTRAQIEVDPDKGPIVGLRMKPAPEKERLSETAPKRTRPPVWEAIQEPRPESQPGPSNNDFRRASRGEIGKDVAFRWGEQVADAFWEHLPPVDREAIERAKGDAIKENLEKLVRTPKQLADELGDELARVEGSIFGRAPITAGAEWERQERLRQKTRR